MMIAQKKSMERSMREDSVREHDIIMNQNDPMFDDSMRADREWMMRDKKGYFKAKELERKKAKEEEKETRRKEKDSQARLRAASKTILTAPNHRRLGSSSGSDLVFV